MPGSKNSTSPSQTRIFEPAELLEIQKPARRHFLTRQKREGGKVRLLLEHMQILPFTGETASHAASLRAALESTGDSIGPMDVLIAATCLEHQLPIVTNNVREFRRIPSLKC